MVGGDGRRRVRAFEETGDSFDPEDGPKPEEAHLLGRQLRDPLEAYVAFRGRAPEIGGLLKKRGLDG